MIGAGGPASDGLIHLPVVDPDGEQSRLRVALAGVGREQVPLPAGPTRTPRSAHGAAVSFTYVVAVDQVLGGQQPATGQSGVDAGKRQGQMILPVRVKIRRSAPTSR
jgi:hypothetical protein